MTNHRYALRFWQLFWGLCLYGFSMALMLRANLGLDPWDVLHQGLAPKMGLSFGMTVNLIGALVLLLWWPLRQRPGIGTIANILVIGTAVDLSLMLLPTPEGLWVRATWLVAGIILNGIAGGAYIGAGMGPGPRDGLMTGLCRRTGWSVKWVRTGIEIGVLAIGWLLGGTVGVGTILYAATIGWIVHHALPFFRIAEVERPAQA
ncbi:hypothetical protein HHL08_16945 [Sphingobium sp. AR-3-1]|uniref:YitT family protein n=1 Tax=Sphingobium psychrophilum TaxID=2728834 RepID=A0A7X9WYE9_9SPHN|nr:hypothetical protein [Sphingobium psychrophilum]NML11818.1 hypothetical protein [Sphingobium psychrophilum]